MTTERDTFYYIGHTHWEGAVFKTRAAYLDMGLPNILRALRLLKAQPTYRFVLDQACYVEPFLERYPEEVAAFKQFVAEGRLAIVGGTDVMLDGNMPGGESFVRQFLYGKGAFRKRLGIDVTVGWQLDTFGHHAQMPQLLRLAGLKSFWFFRGVASWSTPGEFQWEGLDGTQILAFWLPHSYANVYGSPRTLPEFTAFMNARFDALAPFARGPERVGLAGADVCEPEAHVAALVDAFNRQPDRRFNLQIAVPADYEAVVAQRHDLPVVRGELNPIFQGTYSSRIGVKQRTRELEGLLTTAEQLGVRLRLQGVATDAAELWRAWEPMLFNQAHDLMSGVMTDPVYEDTLRGYDFAWQVATEQLTARQRLLCERIDTRGDGLPLVVSNTLGWTRTDVVHTSVGFSVPGMRSLRLLDPEGKDVPVQIESAERDTAGCLVQACITFIAKDIPPMGHAVYRVLPQAAAESANVPVTGTAVLENEFYRLRLAPASGAILGLTVKAGNWEALRAPGNVVAMEEDRGDFWEPYKPLDGGSRIAMTDRHAPPEPGKAVFSTGQTDAAGIVSVGPVFSEFAVAHPFSSTGRFQTRIRLYSGLPRIDIRTTILNHDASVRYRVLFPTTMAPGPSVHEIPFGAVTRPDGIEFPAQNWVACGAGDRGVILLNRGLPGNNVAGGTMMLSLMRSTSIVAYGIGGGYEGQGSGSGLELGKELTFDYALVPHAGAWQAAMPWRHGQAFNQPLLAETVAPHAGPLGKRAGFLDISHANVVVSSLKPGERADIAVLRVYEAAGNAATGVTITLPPAYSSAAELNLLEEPVQKLRLTKNMLRFDLRPFEIKTFGLKLRKSRGKAAAKPVRGCP